METNNEKRITMPDIETITLRNGIVCKIRPLTLKEKRDYLALVSSKTPTKEVDSSNLVTTYLDLQVEVGLFLLKILNSEITREQVEEGVSGDILRRIFDVAFYDPFGFINVEK